MRPLPFLLPKKLIGALCGLLFFGLAIFPASAPAKVIAETSSAKFLRMTLAEAIATALEHNEDIKESYRRISAAEAAVMTAEGAYDVNVFNTSRYGRFDSLTTADYAPTAVTNAARGYLRTDTGFRQRIPTGGSLSTYYTYSHERMLGAFNQRRRADKNYLTVELAQSLLKGIGDKEARGAIQNAVLAVQDSEEGRSMVVSQVVLEVIRAYWMLEMAHNNLQVSKKTLGMAQEVLRREGVRFNQGISQGVDVDRAGMAVKQREYTMLQYERDVAVAQEHLLLLINYPGYSRGTVILPSSSPNKSMAPLPDEQQSFTTALSNRYELKQLAILLKQLDIEYDVNSNKLLPVLDVSGGYTTSNGNDHLRSAENFKDTSNKGSWFVGATFAFPLQNREARGARDRTSQIIRIAHERLSKTRRSVETEIRDALHNLVLAKHGIPVAQSAYEKARKTMNGEMERFEMGGVNNRDLLASHDALGREEINLHAAIVNYNVTLAEYNYACALLIEKCQIAVGHNSARMR
ncbi:MAG: TolC family protein [Desulfovibrionaceae bacterium]|nr:TolC family protein [Desulfovibrionaceae bacterium]